MGDRNDQLKWVLEKMSAEGGWSRYEDTTDIFANDEDAVEEDETLVVDSRISTTQSDVDATLKAQELLKPIEEFLQGLRSDTLRVSESTISKLLDPIEEQVRDLFLRLEDRLIRKPKVPFFEPDGDVSD